MFGLFERTDRIEKEAFKTGYDAGMEEGIRQGMAKNFERSTELSEEEYREVIGYLVSKGLELCCYDVMRGGLRIRKRIYDGAAL
jgi:hypothetical protein